MKMSNFFDEIVEDFDIFNSNFMKRIQKIMNELYTATEKGELKGKWDVKKIDEPGVKGYTIQGRFWSDDPLKPFSPFEPLEPWGRRPIPKRPFNAPENALKEIREPLTDLFNEEKAIRIYVELPGEEKDNIQLNVMEGKIEVKTKNYYKTIDIPPKNIDIEKASSKHKNGVLEITIPKKEMNLDREKHKIEIE